MAAGDIIEEPDEPAAQSPPGPPASQPGQIIEEPEGGFGGSGGSQPVESLSVLPFSRYPNQGWRFDPHAGITGPIVTAAQLTGDVAQGKTTAATDPRTIGAGLGASVLANPDLALRDVAPPARSGAELKAAAKSTRDFVQRYYPVHYPAQGVDSMQNGWASQLYRENKITDKEAPKAFGWWNDIGRSSDGGYVPLQELERARSGLSGLTQSVNPDERTAASSGLQWINNFYNDPNWANPASGAIGPTKEAAAYLDEARANQAAAMRSDRWLGMAQDAKEASLKGGAGYEKQLRGGMNNFARGLDDPQYPGRVKSGFNEAERQAMLKASAAPPGQATIHMVNRIMGETLPWLGEKMGGWMGMGAGMAAKGAAIKGEQLSEGAAHSAFENVDNLIRSRAPLSQQYRTPPPDPGSWQGWFGNLGNLGTRLPYERAPEPPPAMIPGFRTITRPFTAPAQALPRRMAAPAAVAPSALLPFPNIPASQPMIPATSGKDTPLPVIYD
jgi:hypothetical protein